MVFLMQQQLPRLPVPDLKETLAKYLESCKPFASAQQLSDYMEIVGDFSGSFGPVLQKRLVDYEATQEHSWLENWWLKYAYLTWRESCMVHSNWYMLAMDLCPPSYVASNYTGFTSLQISRASALTYQLLQYKLLLQAGKVKPENSKGTELCMHQYTMIFGVTRIPRDNADVLVTFPKSRHVILMIMDQFFVVHVYAKDGSVLGVDGIKRYFTFIKSVQKCHFKCW
jgi:carnitine O-acetyltransferase